MSTSNKDKLKTKKKKKNKKTLWNTMEDDIMTNKFQKNHWSKLEQVMKEHGM